MRWISRNRMWQRMIKSALVAVISVCGFLAQAQSTFQNLNFEDANVVPISGEPFQLTVADALPGWTVDYGNAQQTQIAYNSTIVGGQTTVMLYANGYAGGPAPVIQGNFDVFLQGGNFNGLPADASISQTGVIPAGTQSLLFDASFGPTSPLQLSIGGQQVPFSAVGSGAGTGVDYTVYAANISAWAGYMEPLTFSSAGGANLIDDITFSTQTIPEPSPLALTAFSAVVFALYRIRQIRGGG
jgi:hypothetical protein